MKLLLLPVLMLLPSFSMAAEAPSVEMKFSYVPNEAPELPNGGILECRHARVRDLPDWTVTCGPQGEKTFSAHVVIRIAKRSQEPGTMLEILYWVTEPGDSPTSVRKYHSTTALLQLKDPTDLMRLVLFQGVENDQASLRMTVEWK